MSEETRDLPSNWEIARGAIEHENDVANHRMSWLLTTQGFLFAAFSLVVPALLNNKPSPVYWYAWFFLLCIAILGIVSCIFVQRSLLAANLHHNHVAAWWNRHEGMQYANIPEDSLEERLAEQKFPRVCGTHIKSWWLHVYNLPWVVAGVWGVLLLATIFLMLMMCSTSAAPKSDNITITIPPSDTKQPSTVQIQRP